MEKRTSFVIDISNTPFTLIAIISVVNIFLILMAWSWLGTLCALLIIITCSGFMAYKMLCPNEYMLKINNKTATLYKNQVEVTSCPDHQLDISFTKHYRYGYSMFFSSLNESVLARVHIKFPNKKGIAFAVYSGVLPVFAPDYPTLIFDYKSFLNFNWDAEGNHASEMQVQRLINYYNLNHLLTFQNI